MRALTSSTGTCRRKLLPGSTAGSKRKLYTVHRPLTDPLFVQRIQPGLLRRAGVQNDAIAHADRLAFRQCPGLLDKSEWRRRKMSVVTGEPRARRPRIFGVIHYRQTLDDISKRLAVISAPARR